jgi:hypothetical protein
MPEPHHIPEHIDIHLDGDEGFFSYPLRKHLQGCADCRTALERARAVNDLLERLPHSAPRADFSQRVMSKVQVFEPWYVSLADSAARLIPARGPWRTLTAIGTGAAALTLSALVIWVATRIDVAAYAAHLGWTRLESWAVAAGSSVVSSLFGEAALASVQKGGATTLAIGATLLIAALAVATFGLRTLLATARRRGN